MHFTNCAESYTRLDSLIFLYIILYYVPFYVNIIMYLYAMNTFTKSCDICQLFCWLVINVLLYAMYPIMRWFDFDFRIKLKFYVPSYLYFISDIPHKKIQ